MALRSIIARNLDPNRFKRGPRIGLQQPSKIGIAPCTLGKCLFQCLLHSCVLLVGGGSVAMLPRIMLSAAPASSGRRACARDRHVGVDLVGLRLRLRFVFLAQILDRASRQIGHRQDHGADEARRPVGGLREHRLRTVFVPRAARTVRRRAAVGVDADATVEQAANPRPLMAVQVGEPPGGNATLSPRRSSGPFGNVRAAR